MNSRQKIYNVIEKQIKLGHKDFIIFPYGELGHFAVKVLNNKFKVKQRAIIDNALSDNNPDIKKIQFLRTIDTKESVLLITSSNPAVYDEIRELAYKYMKKGRIIDIFAQKVPNPLLFYKKRIKTKMINPRGKAAFCMTIKNKESIHVLDVGCGNESASELKKICSKVHYIGLDVCDYNQTQQSIDCMDEYIMVPPEEFAKKIEEMQGKVDVVISSHNMEHCNEPERVLIAMIKALKKNGRMFLAFPSEISEYFPHRDGCLNFYDDSTHTYLPQYNKIIRILQNNGMKLLYAKKEYCPFILRKIGEINEHDSKRLGRNLTGTWAYYGFETIIWAKKK